MSNIPASVNGLPPYGNWGGPGWSAGQVTSSGPLTPAQMAVDPIDSLDALFKAHDLAYNTAEYYVTDPATRAADIFAADAALMTGMASLDVTSMQNWSTMTADQQQYAQDYQSAATYLFAAKIIYADSWSLVGGELLSALDTVASALSSTAYGNGMPAPVITTDSSGKASSVSLPMPDIGGIQSTVTADAATGTISTSNVDSATGQLVSSRVVDTTTSSGTTKTYDNGVLASSTDFGANSSTTTTYNTTTGTVSGVSNVNANGSGNSVQYDNYGNPTFSSITDSTGAVTTATSSSDGSVVTRYPNGDVSTTTVNGAGLPTVSTTSSDGIIQVTSYDRPGDSVSLNGSLSNMVDQTGNPVYSATMRPDGSSSVTAYNPDHSGNITNTQADGSYNSTSFSSNGTLTQVANVNANGASTTTNYDILGDVKSVVNVNADGTMTNTSYTFQGVPTEQWSTTTDGTLQHVMYNYDGSVSGYSIASPDGSAYAQGTNPDGTTYKMQQNADGSTLSNTYYDNGVLASYVETDSSGAVTSKAAFNPDGSGNTISYGADGATTTDILTSGATSASFAAYATSMTFSNPDGSTVLVGYGLDGKMSYKQTTFSDGSGLSSSLFKNGSPTLQVVTNADGSGSETWYDVNGYSINFLPGQSPFYVPHAGTPYGSPSHSSNNIATTGGVTYRTVTTTDSTTFITTYYPTGVLQTMSAETTDPNLSKAHFVYGVSYKSYFINGGSPGAYSGINVVSSDQQLFGKTKAYNSTYDERGRMQSQTFTFTDGSSDAISYFATGVVSSETLIHADGSKSTVDSYTNGVIKEKSKGSASHLISQNHATSSTH